jgi:hypothetical protein
MTDPTDTPIYDQLIREQEQQQCTPDPEGAAEPAPPEAAWPSPPPS